ncbi:unnamed protein product [Camellia sinensis]
MVGKSRRETMPASMNTVSNTADATPITSPVVMGSQQSANQPTMSTRTKAVATSSATQPSLLNKAIPITNTCASQPIQANKSRPTVLKRSSQPMESQPRSTFAAGKRKKTFASGKRKRTVAG